MATCCVVFFTVIPSVAFWTLGLVIGGGSGLCTSAGNAWAVGLYLLGNMMYTLNIVASLMKVDDEVPLVGGSWIPSLWGKYRWLGAMCWLFDLWCLGYFLWTRHLFGFSPSTICLSGQGHIGFIGIAGMTGVGLLHLLAVILWRMCRSRQLRPLSQNTTNENLLNNVEVHPY